ncbi:hypothetical protein [Mucilaginibacter sp. NFR10]|uniref:hypothetical protein n=1 Tax=Mucilaginibacter sp. NFR10 TaxID=1566292 RepID=UPI0008716013|nr:hypothetical protein [Mucilaginibacter sp. NFR10]SCW71649.1 hypothetical protein SAMN03159284_03419 [Mucilaginibacter sp. NFR10]
MKKQSNSKPQGQLQLPLSVNNKNNNGSQQDAKVVQFKNYHQKSFIGFILKNSKSF